MSWELVLIFLLKGFVVAMFAMNVGVILTWVDRRQGSMMQDRVGPNRAAIPVPGKIAAGLASGPAVLAAAGAVGLAWLFRDDAADKATWGMLFTQGAIFVFWFTFACIARVVGTRGPKSGFDVFVRQLGSPRQIFLIGVGLHVSVLVFALAFQGTGLAEPLKDLAYGGGAGLLALGILTGAAYVGQSLSKEDWVRIRVAGLLHPAADGLKTVFKGDFIPPNADRFMFNLAPLISFFPALILLAIVPFGPPLCFGTGPDGAIDLANFQGVEALGGACTDARLSLQVADLNVGLLYFFAMAGTGIVGAALAGWASDNKFSLLGGMRAASQMVSYEVTLGLTVVGAIMVYGSVRVDEMVRWQAENAWGIFVQPLAFFLFFAAAVAESKRIPFDIPEGESEIVAGYFTEYSGMKFSMFFFSEYIAVVSGSTLMAALFFGGWHMPFVTAEGIRVAIGDSVFFETSLAPLAVTLVSSLGFVGKVLVLCWIQITIRWTLPRFRYDQLMRLGWRRLLPASLFNIMATAIVVIAIQSAGPQVEEGLAYAGQLSSLLVAVLGLVAVGALVALLLSPRKKQQLLASTSARFAQAMGGTRTAKMEA